MIDFACEHCSARLKVADSAAGKKVRCSQCGQSVLAPEPSGPSNPFGELISPTEVVKENLTRSRQTSSGELAAGKIVGWVIGFAVAVALLFFARTGCR